MAQKLVQIDGLGQAILVRRRGAKHIRLSFNSQGKLRITIPYFLPNSVGVSFARSKKDWIDKHQSKNISVDYIGNQKIGKYHSLSRSPQPLRNNKTVYIKDNVIYFYPEQASEAAIRLERAINKCLKAEAIELLPSRLNKLADQHGYSYEDVKIKKMHSRWGSC